MNFFKYVFYCFVYISLTNGHEDLIISMQGNTQTGYNQISEITLIQDQNGNYDTIPSVSYTSLTNLDGTPFSFPNEAEKGPNFLFDSSTKAFTALGQGSINLKINFPQDYTFNSIIFSALDGYTYENVTVGITCKDSLHQSTPATISGHNNLMPIPICETDTSDSGNGGDNGNGDGSGNEQGTFLEKLDYSSNNQIQKFSLYTINGNFVDFVYVSNTDNLYNSLKNLSLKKGLYFFKSRTETKKIVLQ